MFERSGIRGVIINNRILEVFRKKIFRSFIVPEGSPLIEASAVANIVNFQSLVGFVNLRNFNIIQFCISFFRVLTFLTAEYSLQNRFGSLISLFGLSTILKHCTGKHAHYLRLAAAVAWSREKQMSVALGKVFDMSPHLINSPYIPTQPCSHGNRPGSISLS